MQEQKGRVKTFILLMLKRNNRDDNIEIVYITL